jgi:VWFA-related protein
MVDPGAAPEPPAVRQDVRATCSCLVVALLAPAVASAQSAQYGAGAVRPTFGSSVDMVALNVTVTASSGAYVRDLGPRDFVVYEDGLAQDVTVFGAGDVPIDLVLLLDLSASVRDRVDLVRAAAKGFLRTLREDDRGAVIGFNQSVRVLSALTSDKASLSNAVDSASASGGTALYSALYIALRGLDGPRRRAAPPAEPAPPPAGVQPAEPLRRRVLVVLSDGLDTSSLVSYEDVLQSLRESGVLLYTIHLKRLNQIDIDALLPGRRAKPTGEYVLRTLARETGARAFTAQELTALPGIYADIAAELSSQYLLGFVPVSHEGAQKFHALSVAVPGRANAQARTRMGYLLDPARLYAATWSGDGEPGRATSPSPDPNE